MAGRRKIKGVRRPRDISAVERWERKLQCTHWAKGKMVGISDKEIAARLAWHGVTLKKKSSSPLMRFLAKLLWFNRRFMVDFWVTIVTPWSATIYYPDPYGSEIRALQERGTLWHELTHVEQARAQGRFWGPILFAIAYLLIPLPIYFAYCRAHYECEAYAATRAKLIPQADKNDEAWSLLIAETLWTSYGRTMNRDKCAKLALQYLEAKRALAGG